MKRTSKVNISSILKRKTSSYYNNSPLGKNPPECFKASVKNETLTLALYLSPLIKAACSE